MRKGTHRYQSQEEESQALRYLEFLRTERKVTNQKSLAAYKGAVTASGKLTQAARAAGLLEGDGASLLTVEGPEQVQALADWWDREGRSLCPGYKTHMAHWLAFLGAGDQPRETAERVAAQSFRPPLHGVRLRFVLQAFFADSKVTSTEMGMDLYETLLRPLSGRKDRLFCTTDSLKEHTAAFRRLCLEILEQTEREPEETAAAIAAAFPYGLVSACRNTVSLVMERHGSDLLLDLGARPVAWEDSLLPRLEKLWTAVQGEDVMACAQGLTALVRAVLLDGVPARQAGDLSLDPGVALRDSRLWESSLLWSWMEWGPLPGGAVEVLLTLPPPDQADRQGCLSAVLLHSMLRLAPRPDGLRSGENWSETERWLELAIVFCRDRWPVLSAALSKPAAPWCPPVPEPWTLGDARNTLLMGALLCWQAELLLAMPAPGDPGIRLNVRLIRAQSSVRAGKAAVKARLSDGQALLEVLTGRPSAVSLLARLCLCEGKIYRRFALLETDECCLSDVLEQYIRPCRRALSDPQAFSAPGTACPGEQWDEEYRQCCQTFFAPDSPVVRRLRLFPGQDDRDFQAECAAWGRLSPAPAPAAPSVRLPLDPETLRDPERFKPVYSGSFDSVLGSDPAQQKPAELTAFQLLGSAQTSLLQMNQVVDNLAVLRLLHEPGFRAACREGLISLSCFLDIHTPALYLRRKLMDPGFRFSCSQAFTLPESFFCLDADAQQRYLRRSPRGVMLRYLEGNATLSEFPDGCDKQEMDFLAESWKLAFDSFRPSDLRRYHQNDASRFPPRRPEEPRPAPCTLSQMLRGRLDLLIEEAEQPGSGKDLGRLLAVRDLADRLGELRDRSSYDNVIDALQRSSPDPALEDLRAMVHQSYFLANGSRCCRHILLTEQDPCFVLLEDRTLQVDYGAGAPSPTTEYVYRQAWRPGTGENIGWPDLCEIALINRELTLRSQGLSPERQIAEREAHTGLTYCQQGDDILLSEYTARLAAGERTHVAPAAANTADARFLELYRSGN